jgi:hypothetical protein
MLLFLSTYNQNRTIKPSRHLGLVEHCVYLLIKIKNIIMANIKDTKSEIEKIDEYTAKGYTSSYQMIDGKFTDLETNESFTSDQVIIEDEYRYEGMSDPGDMSILYIINVPGRSKGTLLIPYGPSGDGSMGWFMSEVSLNKHNKDKTTLNKV